MSTYVSSQFAMKTGQGRHRFRRRMPDVSGLQVLNLLVAFAVSTTALSGGVTLLLQAGLSAVQLTPAISLGFSSGVAFVLMTLVAGSRVGRG